MKKGKIGKTKKVLGPMSITDLLIGLSLIAFDIVLGIAMQRIRTNEEPGEDKPEVNPEAQKGTINNQAGFVQDLPIEGTT